MSDLPGTLRIRISDHNVQLVVAGGAQFEIPVGPIALLDGPLEHANPPTAAHLTNALAMVQDYFDGIVIEAPSVAAAPTVVAEGHHALALARVEIGAHDIPDSYSLRRSDADEVFRMLATEPSARRRSNPALDEADVESVVGTCCVILGIMRRLDLSEIVVDSPNRAVS